MGSERLRPEGPPPNSESVPSPLLTGEPTLLDLLEFAADHFEAVSRDMPPLAPFRELAATRAARLRAARERLESEMRRAELEPWGSNIVVKDVLARVNGGGPHGR